MPIQLLISELYDWDILNIEKLEQKFLVKPPSLALKFSADSEQWKCLTSFTPTSPFMRSKAGPTLCARAISIAEIKMEYEDLNTDTT